MLHRIRQRLTYANVVATLALFVALGGSSYAAITISGKNVKNSSLTWRDLKRNTLGGSRIKESRLGKVPRAGRADLVGGVSVDQLRVRCPAVTTPVASVCIETAARRPTSYGSAVTECAGTDPIRSPGRRLPTHGELSAVLSGVPLAPGGELTSEVFPSGSEGQLNVLYVTTRGGSVGVTPDTGAGGKAFRCVATPLN